MKTEKEKMLAGELYTPYDSELQQMHQQALALVEQYNKESFVNCLEENPLLGKLLPNAHPTVRIQPPFLCDFGFLIYGGENGFINYGCTILDTAPITLGKNILIGPNVQIYAPIHPYDYTTRATGVEHGEAITIGDDCWIGGGVVICPGVTIGNRCIIGAGSVVVKDIPDDSFAAGNPAIVKKRLDL